MAKGRSLLVAIPDCNVMRAICGNFLVGQGVQAWEPNLFSSPIVFVCFLCYTRAFEFVSCLLCKKGAARVGSLF